MDDATDSTSSSTLVAGWLLQGRLEAKRCLEPLVPLPGPWTPSSSSKTKLHKSFKDVAKKDFRTSSRWVSLSGHRKGDVVFTCEALACVYEDELQQEGDKMLLGTLASRMPRSQEAADLLRDWGLGPGSRGEEVSQAFERHSQHTWYFSQPPQSSGARRVSGLAVFPFSGLLRHSHEPSLVITYAASGCVAVASRDIDEGEELTLCLAAWRFNETLRQRELLAAGVDKDSYSADSFWPKALPSKDSAQGAAAVQFLAGIEQVAWGEGFSDTETQIALKKLRDWLHELDGSPSRKSNLFQESPYLCFRAHALALHLCTGVHCLEEAWDSTKRIIELLKHIPLHEVSELCVTLALLGAGLAYGNFSKPERVEEIFVAGSTLLAELFGAGKDLKSRRKCWALWLQTFLPEPLLGSALKVVPVAEPAAPSVSEDDEQRLQEEPSLDSHDPGVQMDELD
eukprot:TRINITY_DN16054_c1_g1_i1.p1 TRINITY_DN16054_c1_g1~~TRINITY_DN16054_c1_g1_i1.p1  ORF type:complete len:454 (+),score=84.46 TRINITY_DN16054_c1_g1_i1:48-1409(+)